MFILKKKIYIYIDLEVWERCGVRMRVRVDKYSQFKHKTAFVYRFPMIS